jgi:hypothetical protein
MTEERIVVHRDADPVYDRSTVVERTTTSPSGGEVGRRLIVFLFAIVQTLLLLRILLLLLAANPGDGLVQFIYDASGVFVAPFEGVLRTDAISAEGSVLDVAAAVALVGWTLLEAVLLALMGVFRREPA